MPRDRRAQEDAALRLRGGIGGAPPDADDDDDDDMPTLVDILDVHRHTQLDMDNMDMVLSLWYAALL